MVIEKIEIEKNTGNYTYTGELVWLQGVEEGNVEIRTTHNEVLRFRKEQIMQRRILDKI